MTNWKVIQKLQEEGLFLDANTRLRIDYAGTRLRDVLPEMEIAVLPYRQAKWLDVAVDTFSLNAELEKLKEELFDPELDNWEIFEAHLAGENFFSCVMELAGTSQGEWADVVVYARDPLQDETKNFIHEIFRGDSYYIYKEERTVYTAPDGRTREEWETLEISSDYAESDVWDGLADCENISAALKISALMGRKTLIAPLIFATIEDNRIGINRFNLRLEFWREKDGLIEPGGESNAYEITRSQLLEAIFCHARRDYLSAY